MMDKKFNSSGFTLIEMTIALGLTVVLGVIVYGVSQYADRQTKIQTEDMQSLILKYGASKVIVDDFSNAAPSFNFINFQDDQLRPFYVYSQNELCTSPDCSRQFTMAIPANKIESEPFFMLIIKSDPSETIRFNVDPIMMFKGTPPYNYIALNYEKVADSTQGISKSVKDHSPWEPGRLILLQTTNSYFDCNSTVLAFSPMATSKCNITCPSSVGNCPDFAVARPLKLLGTVNGDELDMTFKLVDQRLTLLKNKYKICRPDKNMDCTVYNNIPNLNTSRKLFEKMPYVPGSDNLATITPVQLVRYHLERPATNSPDSKILLMRSTATIVGGELSFERAHILMTGIQSIVFTRKNVSTPTIEYKLNKVRYQQAIK